jgi:hypothetical protein
MNTIIISAEMAERVARTKKKHRIEVHRALLAGAPYWTVRIGDGFFIQIVDLSAACRSILRALRPDQAMSFHSSEEAESCADYIAYVIASEED